MRVIRRAAVRPIIGVLLAGSALVGCATGTPDLPSRDGGVPAAAVQPRWTSCADGAPALFGTAGPGSLPPLPGTDPPESSGLPDGFAATAAALCRQEDRRRADGGTDLVAIEQRAEDVEELLIALLLPDMPRTGDPCPAIAIHLPWFALLDEQGRWTRPGVPGDGCGQPRIEVRDALAGLVLTEVTARPLAEIGSAEAAAAGCPQTWTHMVTMHTRRRPPAPAATGGLPLTAAEPVRLCVYQVPPDERGSDKPAGVFAHGTVLPPARWSRIRAALSAREPASGCSTPGGRFAVLVPTGRVGNGPEVNVELDGCRRVLTVDAAEEPRLTQGDDTLAELFDR